MSKRIKILDCTLRDGGHALEDACNGENPTQFYDTHTQIQLVDYLVSAQIDVIELGSIYDGVVKHPEFSVFQNIEQVCELLPKRKSKVKFAVLYRSPDICESSIPVYRPGLPELARVVMRYSELEKSHDFCRMLANKGYKVCIQPMVTSRYTVDQLKQLASLGNEINAFALYIVDSYGSMSLEDLERIYNIYNSNLDRFVCIGLHAHNNLGAALENSKWIANRSKEREVVVDSTVYGIGQGAGNCRTELLAHHINSFFRTTYEMECILEACSLLDRFRAEGEAWGLVLLKLVRAVRNTA